VFQDLEVFSGSTTVSGGISVLAGASCIFNGTASATTTINGAINVASSAVFTVDSSAVISAKGGAVVQGTGIIKGNLNGNYTQSAGVLKGIGHIAGTVYIQASANLTAGLSPGTIYIDGDLHLDAASYTQIEADSDTNYDRIIVGGKAYLNGNLALKLGYSPKSGQTYDSIISYTNGYTGSFITLTTEGFVNFFTTKVNPNYGGISTSITFINNSSALFGPSFSLLLFIFFFSLFK